MDATAVRHPQDCRTSSGSLPYRRRGAAPAAARITATGPELHQHLREVAAESVAVRGWARRFSMLRRASTSVGFVRLAVRYDGVMSVWPRR